MIAHDRGAGQVSAFEPHFGCRITRITINPTMMRAITAAYSLEAESVNRDAGTLTNRTVTATNTMVIARPIQIVRTRVVLGFTIVACSEMPVTANLDLSIFAPKTRYAPLQGPVSDTKRNSTPNETELSRGYRERG